MADQATQQTSGQQTPDATSSAGGQVTGGGGNQLPAAMPANQGAPAADGMGGTAQAILSDAATTQAQPVVVAPSAPGGKERAFPTSEAVPIIEVTGTDALEKEPIPPEVEAWMEKVNQTAASGKREAIEIQKTQAPVAGTPSVPKNVFVLPLGEVEMKKGLGASVNDSIRWLATWCTRMMKRLGPAAVLRQG